MLVFEESTSYFIICVLQFIATALVVNSHFIEDFVVRTVT